YLYTPLALRGAAIGILSLLRNEGGSVGVSLSQTFEERRDQFHTLRLGESLLSTRPWLLSSRRLKRSSLSKPAIRPRRSNSLGSNSKTCASSRGLRLPFSTPFGWRPC